MYQIILQKRVQKSLKKIDKRFLKKIMCALDLLQTDPYIGKPLDGELEGKRSCRVWPYRIIYSIYQHKLIILTF